MSHTKTQSLLAYMCRLDMKSPSLMTYAYVWVSQANGFKM